MHVLWPAAAPAAQPWPRFVMRVPCMPYVPTSGRLPQTCVFYGTYAINFRKKCENVSKNDPASSWRTVKGAHLDPKGRKDVPKAPQSVPKVPIGCPKAPKVTQEGAKMEPKWYQNRAKRRPRKQTLKQNPIFLKSYKNIVFYECKLTSGKPFLTWEREAR